MKTIPSIKEMSKAEKLQMMEALWTDLSQSEDDCESPDWHEAILKEREERIQEGREEYVSWEKAKKMSQQRHCSLNPQITGCNATQKG